MKPLLADSLLLLLLQDLTNPTDKRIFAIATALYDTKNYSVKKLAELTQIDPWFLHKMNNVIKMTKRLEAVDYKVLQSPPPPINKRM